MTKEIEKYFDMTENKTTTYRTLWDAIKAVLTEEFVTVKDLYWKKKKVIKSIINLLPQKLENDRKLNLSNKNKD